MLAGNANTIGKYVPVVLRMVQSALSGKFETKPRLPGNQIRLFYARIKR
jgi:hypothetical protein